MDQGEQPPHDEQPPHEQPILVRKRDVRPLDILVGRGHFRSSGNDRYLRIVSERQAEYRAARYADKEQIAREVLEKVYGYGLDDDDDGGSGESGSGESGSGERARFLQLEPDEDHRRPDSLWRVVAGKVVLDKVKMNLRQKSAKARKAAESAVPAAAEAEAESAVPAAAEAEAESVPAGRDGGVGAGAGAHATAVGSAAGPIVQTDPMQFLLQLLQVAQQQMQALCTKYYPAEGASLYEGTHLHPNMAEDLHHLGNELYNALTREDALLVWGRGGIAANSDGADDGKTDYDNGEAEHRAAKRRGGREAPLIDFGYPSNLSLFVATLLDSTSHFADDELVTVQELDEELRLMLEDPDKYLAEATSAHPVVTGAISIPPKLYGQERPMERLVNAYQSVFVTRQNDRGLVLISGRAGSGKSSLAESVLTSLGSMHVAAQMISIKFNSQGSVQPMSEIIRSFDKYCLDLQSDENLKLSLEVRDRVQRALGPMSQVLFPLMPNFASLAGEVQETPQLQMDSSEMHNMLLYALQAFLRSIGTPSHPVILLFDDLQWADKGTFALIRKLAADEGTAAHSTLFVGCYREEAVQNDPTLMENLNAISQAVRSTWEIAMEPLQKNSINDLLSDAFQQPPRLTKPLAKEVFNKTQGNPMFIRQLLKSLCGEGLLGYSARERCWRWDIAKIRSKTIADSAVELVLGRMTMYGAEVMWALKIGALIGNRFDASTMQLFHAGSDGGGDGSSILTAVDFLVEDGIVSLDGAMFRFNHDVLWQAAYALTPTEDIEKTHLFIGQRLLKGASCHSSESVEIHLNTIVDQMNRGATELQGRNERIRLAELNLQAGKNSLDVFDFLQASIHFLQGTVLVDDEAWSSDYDLTLSLYRNCVETQLALGNHSNVVISSHPILLNARCLHDKLEAYHALITALISQNEMQQALDHCRSVLEALGEALPSAEDVSQLTVKREFEATVGIISPLKLEDIVNLPTMTDEDKKSAVRFLILACRSLWGLDPLLYTIAILRCVVITVHCGLTPEASLLFSAYALILYNLEKYDASAAYARVALSLLKKYHNRHGSAVHSVLNLSIFPLRQPLQACSNSLFSWYKDTVATGITEFALLALGSSTIIDFFAPGEASLVQVSEKFRWVIDEMKKREHYLSLTLSLYQQVIMNISNPSTETVSALDATNDPSCLHMQDLAVEDMEKLQKVPRVERLFLFCRLLLAYLYRNYGAAVAVADNLRQLHLSKGFYASFELIQEAFYLGLVSFWIVRQGEDDPSDTWLSLGRDITTKMKGWAENGSSWNFSQKYLLLLAEQAFAQNDVELAISSYDKAVAEAKEHKFINEAALASECAGEFYLDQGNLTKAREYLSSAESAYRRWGALRKADHVHSIVEGI